LTDRPELLLAGRADEADRRPPEAQARAEADVDDLAAALPPLRPPSRVEDVEDTVQRGARLVHEPVEEGGAIDAGELGEEQRQETVPRVLEDDASMVLPDLGQLGQVHLDERGEVLRVLERAGQLGEAAHVEGQDGDGMRVRHEETGMNPRAQPLLDGEASRMVRRRGDRAGEETYERGTRRTEPSRGLARNRTDRRVWQPGRADDRGLGPRLDQPAGDRRRQLGLARAARDDEIEMARLVANGIDGAARGPPRHPVAPRPTARREPPQP